MRLFFVPLVILLGLLTACNKQGDTGGSADTAAKGNQGPPTSLLDSLQGRWHVLNNAPRSITNLTTDEKLALLGLAQTSIAANGGIHPDTVYMTLVLGANGKGEQNVRAPEGSFQEKIIYTLQGRTLSTAVGEKPGDGPTTEFTVISVTKNRLTLRHNLKLDTPSTQELLKLGVTQAFIDGLYELWVLERVQ